MTTQTTDHWRLLIQRIRHARGWSQDQLAAEVGTSATNVSRWERGETVPRTKTYVERLVTLDAREGEAAWQTPTFREQRIVTECAQYIRELAAVTGGRGEVWTILREYLKSLLRIARDEQRLRPSGSFARSSTSRAGGGAGHSGRS